MEDLLAMARRPAVTIGPDATAHEAAALMVAEKVGAAVVLDGGGKLLGIVSERDIMARLVVPKRDPGTTHVREIMTSKVLTALASETPQSALEKMVAHHIRHLPIVDASGAVLGTLSVRHLLREQLGALALRTVDLENFIAADGAGG